MSQYFQSTTSTALKRSGNLIETTSVPSENIQSRWREVMDYSSLNGMLSADAGVELIVEQSIDGETVDKTETIAPSAVGDAQPFEIPLFADYVRVTLNVTGSPTTVRALAYMSTRASSITQT